MEKNELTAVFFDLDGVIFDTEPLYTTFWRSQCILYHPERPHLEMEIKGQTLIQIFEELFSGALASEREIITQRLDGFESQMQFSYVPGFTDFMADLRSNAIKTAVVTSGNQKKMRNVYKQHPHFQEMFDAILTAENFMESKPSPDCYLYAAKHFGFSPSSCVVFEDSFNGLRAGRAAGMFTIGLTTTNDRDALKEFSDVQIPDYKGMDFNKLKQLRAS